MSGKGRLRKLCLVTVDELLKNKKTSKQKKRKTRSLKNKRQFGAAWVMVKNKRVKSTIMNSVGFN